MRRTIKDELFRLKEEKYKCFSLKLLPGIPEESLIGVRIPLLRKIAGKAATSGEWEEYLKENENLYFEEKMIQGMIIGKIKISPEYRLSLIEDFIPKIDNWSLCDSFCTSLKFAREDKNKEIIWNFIEPLFINEIEYHVRFASVMSLNYFLNPVYLDKVLRGYKSVNHQGYYAKMAVAWGISMAFINDSAKTKEFLKENSLDNFTYNKAIQKIRESYQVSQEDKDFLKLLNKGTRN